ncbi:MAG: NAD-dependent epimerase/dehydratase family protein [Bacteroidales bacterium]|nr:NAD-dependent epimerase/dehydratase family protein [Bacteroidales bacterium]
MIVVTGGTGLVGSHLLFDLCNKFEQVCALKRSNSDLNQVKKTFTYYSKNAEELFQKIDWVDADVSDYSTLENALQGAKKVYHCAAMVSFHEADDQKMMKINVQGTANVVNASIYNKVEKLCFVSSIAAIGKANSGELANEETPWKNADKTSAYSRSKYLAELEVWRGMEEGLNAVIVNPSVILGPAKWNSGSAALFSLVYKGLKFYTPGVNGYVSVLDVSKAMIHLMESPISNERFILNSENLTYQELFNAIAISLGKKAPTTEVKPWMSELSWRLMKLKTMLTRKQAAYTKNTARSSMKKSYYSNAKIQQSIGFQFQSIQEIIEQTATHFLNDH